MENYFVIQNGNKEGPYSLNEIIDMKLPEFTLVWKHGLTNWIELRELPDYKINVPPPIPESVISSFKQVLSPETNLVPDIENDKCLNETESKNEPETLNKFAGFWLRFFAFLIDFFILFFITSFIWVVFHIPIPSNAKSFLDSKFSIFSNPIGIIWGWLYYALFESSHFQATPGKVIMGLLVVDPFYRKIKFWQASGRFLVKSSQD